MAPQRRDPHPQDGVGGVRTDIGGNPPSGPCERPPLSATVHARQPLASASPATLVEDGMVQSFHQTYRDAGRDPTGPTRSRPDSMPLYSQLFLRLAQKQCNAARGPGGHSAPERNRRLPSRSDSQSPMLRPGWASRPGPGHQAVRGPGSQNHRRPRSQSVPPDRVRSAGTREPYPDRRRA